MLDPITTQPVYETVRWLANKGVDKQQMIEAMISLSNDLKSLPGFIEQTLYQRENNQWLAVYYWETAQQAHDSNLLVADKDSFIKLVSLIQADSIEIEVLSALQQAKTS
jgi:hypothetical protein